MKPAESKPPYGGRGGYPGQPGKHGGGGGGCTATHRSNGIQPAKGPPSFSSPTTSSSSAVSRSHTGMMGDRHVRHPYEQVTFVIYTCFTLSLLWYNLVWILMVDNIPPFLSVEGRLQYYLIEVVQLVFFQLGFFPIPASLFLSPKVLWGELSTGVFCTISSCCPISRRPKDFN